MARMHTRRRGSSGSDKPSADEPPEWSDVDSDDIEARVVELAEQGHDPSQIGMKLRDEGVTGTPVPDVKLATGKKITEILEENDAKSEFPEDLRNLMIRAVRLREHVRENQQDFQNKRALQNTEAKVRRLVKYYRGDEIEPDFQYSYEVATELLELEDE
ncbi:30S ribosomal protein S15 [Natrinema sp. H-ect4]|uniref:30S ribosomal protein S15 n=1 Tax=Natrinema sp. H-ect4 TaxID=3242699 RepID=UPI0035A842D5